MNWLMDVCHVVGTYAASDGTPFSQRSLPPDAIKPNNYYKYLVLMPFDAVVGVTAPAFGQPGGGMQYHLIEPDTFNSLIQEGYLENITSSYTPFQDEETKIPDPC